MRQTAHLPHVFPEEASCRLPTGTELDLGVFDLDERRHQRIQALPDDAEGLFAYLAERGVPFCINHPFSPLTGRREPVGLPFAFERARGVEAVNGIMPRTSNDDARAARTRQEFLAGLRSGHTIGSGRSGTYARVTADVATVFLAALGENADLAGRTLADFGRFCAVAALVPVMLLMPAITALNYARERLIAGVHG